MIVFVRRINDKSQVKNEKSGRKGFLPVNVFYFAALSLFCSLFSGLGILEPCLAAPLVPGDWQLTWSDEFDSGPIPEFPNPNNWGYESGYVRNKEWQYYTDSIQNAYCQDGFLHIEAHQHPPGTYPTGSEIGQDGSISSASLKSKGLVEYQYGWLEMRARIDIQWGSWPAFWTLGSTGEWPDNGECDIMEYYRDMLKFNVAWWKTGDARWTARWDSVTVYVSSLPPEWPHEFHVWAMEWTPDYVKLYMDGILYNTWDSSLDDNGDGDTSVEGFQQPHYIILNQAIGGTAGGDASGVVYPTNYEIDYVRWYQLDMSGPMEHYAKGETTTSGIVDGSFADTTDSDDVYEQITEIQSGGNPSNQYSFLEHTWTINIGTAPNPVLFVEAYHTANSEGDDFVFAYSSDNFKFNDVITVTKTSDDNIAQGAALPDSLTGTVYIRVMDADRSQGNSTLDTIYVDKLFIYTGTADLNIDGKVDLQDVAELSRDWQMTYEMNALLDIVNNWLYGTSR